MNSARVEVSLHVVLPFLLIELALLLRGGVLVLLVLGHEVVHVALRLGELHFVHALPRIPMQESFAAEHGGKKLCDTLEHLLNGCRVAGKGNSHLQTLWWNVAYACLNVIGNPLHEVAVAVKNSATRL